MDHRPQWLDRDDSPDVFAELESEVRSYCRSWPALFAGAAGSHLWDTEGRTYVDFFAGAGSLNYGHNHPLLRDVLIDHLRANRVTHGLDMYTPTKAHLLRTFDELVLGPRGLRYKIQFPGPTGTNAVEAALKLARKCTGRSTIVSFASGFHGMTLGSLAVSGNNRKRSSAGVPLPFSHVIPFDDPAKEVDASLEPLTALLSDPGSGVERPAAVIVETVQGEGGVRIARAAWLRALAQLCAAHGVLLIIDDVQMGVGRTGGFFSFEESGIQPDIVCLAKSISGYGLPMAMVLLRPELDVWEPGEHNGTFRGNNLAFSTAAEALGLFWRDAALMHRVRVLGDQVSARLGELVDHHPGPLSARGRGLVHGLETPSARYAEAIVEEAFGDGLLLETSGAAGNVVKLLPALTIDDTALSEGLDVLGRAVEVVLHHGEEPDLSTGAGPRSRLSASTAR